MDAEPKKGGRAKRPPSLASAQGLTRPCACRWNARGLGVLRSRGVFAMTPSSRGDADLLGAVSTESVTVHRGTDGARWRSEGVLSTGFRYAAGLPRCASRPRGRPEENSDAHLAPYPLQSIALDRAPTTDQCTGSARRERWHDQGRPGGEVEVRCRRFARGARAGRADHHRAAS